MEETADKQINDEMITDSKWLIMRYSYCYTVTFYITCLSSFNENIIYVYISTFVKKKP